TLQEYQKRMKKLDQQYKERIRNAELFLQLEFLTSVVLDKDLRLDYVMRKGTFINFSFVYFLMVEVAEV
ncbi:hypothetical protein chiPu_0025243, partial [Chiloscyllium punctatum]|nr:hypothetical protein [Chiloscyllium punctatum]